MSEPMTLAYEERGGGPAMVMIHGFPLNRTMWIPQLAGLAKVRRCIALDLRGHGLSEDSATGEYSMDLFADDVAKTLDDAGADTADVCGLSMGGYVAFAFWRRHRDRVRSLILCDTKAEADTDEGKAGREKTAAMVREQGMEPLVEALQPKLFGAAPSADVVAKVNAMILSTPPEVAAADSLAMAARPDSTPDLAGIDVPVLWLHGEQDQLMPIDGARATAAKIKDATFVGIPSGGHMAPMENPDAANAALVEFLKRIS